MTVRGPNRPTEPGADGERAGDHESVGAPDVGAARVDLLDRAGPPRSGPLPTPVRAVRPWPDGPPFGLAVPVAAAAGPELRARVLADHATTGLLPFLTGPGRQIWADADGGDLAVETWDPSVVTETSDGLEASTVLIRMRDRWPRQQAPATGRTEDLDGFLALPRLGEDDGWLVLVVAEHAWQVPEVTGFHGPTNHLLDPQELAAVLRDWEERFGAVLVGQGYDGVELEVARPPRSGSAAATALAEELYVVCPDVVEIAGSLEATAHELLPRSRWRLWWD